MSINSRHIAIILGMGTVCLMVAAPVAAQRTSVGRDFPVYANGGKPDLTVDPKRFVSQMAIVDRYFDLIDDVCAFDEQGGKCLDDFCHGADFVADRGPLPIKLND